ncbi:MAG: hypothetical protein M0Z53_00525 [Thermaerobacter sp.]|nr:hypothetical protein [Thermaerobacter sp.]
MSNSRIRVAVVDDHPVVREGLRTFLQGAADLELIGVFARASDLLAIPPDTPIGWDRPNRTHRAPFPKHPGGCADVI